MSLATKSLNFVQHNALGFGLSAVQASGDYHNQVKNGTPKNTAAISSFLTNIVPALAFTGAGMGAMFYQGLYSVAPMVPSIVSAVALNRAQHESYVRNSSLPFSYNGFQPSLGAMHAMQKGMEATGQARGLAGTHAALASQALRR